MLSKFSVRKPYTVVVAVVLVLILGFVSFGNMTTDLLPNISLPYAIVMTSYPGASPSAVEEVVSKPVEQAMATVSNIEAVQSISQENVSLVILQFAQSSNMDAVSLEMREKLDQIGGMWEDSVGKPTIMKLNPNMLPVLVTAVEKEGMDSIKITDYVERELLPEVESLEGVASVDTSGTVKERVDVILRQEKIDAVNEKIRHAMEGEFADAKNELSDAKTELNDAQKKIEDGKSSLAGGKDQLSAQLGGAKSQLTEKQNEVLKTELDLERQLSLLTQKEEELKKTEAELSEKEKQLQAAQEQLSALPKQKAELEKQKKELLGLQTQLQELQTTLPVLRENILKLEEQLKNAGENLTEEEVQQLTGQLTQAQQQLVLLETGLAQSGVTEEQIPDKLKELEAGIAQLNEGLAQLDKAIVTLPEEQKKLEEGKAQLAAGKQQIAEGKAGLAAAKAQITSAKEKIAAGKVTMSQALAELNRQEISAIIEMAGAQAELAAGAGSLESGKKQLEEGEKTLEEQEEKAYEQADLSGKLTIDMVQKILAAQNFSMPAGYVTEEGIQYLVRVGDKFSQMEDMKHLVLFDPQIEGVDPIRLSDVADVIQTDNASEVYAKINGKAGVMLSINKQTNYSTGEVTNRLNDYFEKKMQSDAGLHVTNLMDQGIYIDMVVNSVLSNLGFGAVLAVLILLLFLRDLRPTLVVACSIPISVMTAIVLMYFSGVTLNIISLSGLALGVGMLVDNSIVVIENIFRLRSLGHSRKEAAIEGAKQVSSAIVASTLTTVCVFAPIIFTKGITRQLFVDMGLTIGYSLLASLIVALTLVPMMAAGLLKKKEEKPMGAFGKKVMSIYGKMIEGALRFKPLVLLGAVVMLVVSVMAAASRGTLFMPEMESTQTSVSLTLPKGSSVEETGAMADEVMKRIAEIPDVEETGAMAGGSGMMGMGRASTNTASMYLILKEEKELTGEQLKQEILEKTKDLDCEVAVQTSSMDMSALGSSGIAVQIQGRDLDRLQELAKETAELVRGVEGTEEVSDGMEDSTGELRIKVNTEKAAEYQLTTAQIFQQVREKLADAATATTLAEESKDYPVMVVDENRSGYDREAVKKFTITVTEKDGSTKKVPLEELVEFSETVSPQSIKRANQTRYLTVTASIAQGHNIGLVAQEVQKAIKNIELPDGYSIEMTGEDETIRESMVEVLKMLGLAIVFMYLIMVAQFQSLLSPFIVMFTIPLAFTGGFLGLFFAGEEISVVAMIGFVMLSGIIVNNGIVLVDYINQLQAEGMERRAAIVEAGKTRIRPILMTALTTILGLSTMAMGFGMGADMVQPMAIVTIGGLLYGTVLTLFVVPCIYDLLNHRNYKKEIIG